MLDTDAALAGRARHRPLQNPMAPCPDAGELQFVMAAARELYR
jgi:hypothetical protein